LKKRVLIFLALLLIASACSVETQPTGIVTPTLSASGTGNWYAVYFTDPNSPVANSFRGGPDEALAAAIDQSRLSVDMSIYDLNLWSIRDALIAAHRRGVTVRLVMESDNMDEQEVQDLMAAGIEVLGDRHESLMHGKFVVIDRSEVWTGSMNFTMGGGYLDNNNLVLIRSTKLAEDYTTEFEQMFVEDAFSNEKQPKTPNPSITVNGTPIEVSFSPQDGTLKHILELVISAKENIRFIAYSFTSDELREALIERASAGVEVRGVFDEDQANSNIGTEYEALKNAGIDVKLDGNPHLMHHKVIIIDNQIVVTGSYNFSNNAEYNNDENTIIIHNSDFAAQYLDEFQQVYYESTR
jgi:phosphatidylserine/phosphatidylglycerophosphate/cardiolipin synthase-like enzyme